MATTQNGALFVVKQTRKENTKVKTKKLLQIQTFVMKSAKKFTGNLEECYFLMKVYGKLKIIQKF